VWTGEGKEAAGVINMSNVESKVKFGISKRVTIK